MQDLSDLWRFTSPDAVNTSGDFFPKEFAASLHHLKPGKAPGPDSICPEFLIHAVPGLKFWLATWLPFFLFSPTQNSKSLEKGVGSRDPHACREPKELPSHLSALCPLQDPRTTDLQSFRTNSRPLASKGQAGFRHEKSTVDQVVLLTQNILLRQKKNAGAVFVDLTAAYDTVWHRGLTCKLLRLLPDKHMVQMIMELVWNRSFSITTADSKPSRLRRLKNGLPQGSVLAPLLFNI